MPIPWPFRSRRDPAAIARRHAREAIATLVDEMQVSGKQRVRAALALLDRGFGRTRVAEPPPPVLSAKEKIKAMKDAELSAAIDIVERHINGEKILPPYPRFGRRRHRGARGRWVGGPSPVWPGSGQAPEAGPPEAPGE